MTFSNFPLYVCVFVSLSVKAIHLELVSEPKHTLRRFIARCGKPSLIQSDHGSNFVGAKKELEQLAAFLQQQKTQDRISQFCASPVEIHPGKIASLWRAAVESFKFHLKRVTNYVKLKNGTRSMSALLSRRHVRNITRHFWKRWSL